MHATTGTAISWNSGSGTGPPSFRVESGSPERVTITSVTSPRPDQSLVWKSIRVPFSAAGFRPSEPSIAVAFLATWGRRGVRTQPDCHRNASFVRIMPFNPRTSTI